MGYPVTGSGGDVVIRDNIKNAILALSNALDEGSRAVLVSPLLGLSFARARREGTLAALLAALSFTHQGKGLWRRSNGEETYEEHDGDSEQGYLSLGELDRWRQSLLQRCAALMTLVHLPPAESMMLEDRALLAPMLGELVDATPGLRVVFAPGTDPRSELAALTAAELMPWPQAFGVLIEDLHARQMLTAQAQAALLDALETHPAASEVALAVSRRLACRLGQPVPPGPQVLRTIADQLAAFR